MEILNEAGNWVYALGAFVLLTLLLLLLWYRVQLNTKKIERDLKILEAQYQDKMIESNRGFFEKQERFIAEKLKELEVKEKTLAEALENLEETNIKKLHKLIDNFEKKVMRLQEENEREAERRIQAVQEKYEKKIEELKKEKDRENELLREERRKILSELEEYQRDLRMKAKKEMERIHENYEKQMENLQSENAKLLDEMNRMMEMRMKASQPPQQLPMGFHREPPGPKQFSEETLQEIEKQIQKTVKDMEKLKEQFVEVETKRKLEFELAQQEIEELKFKIRHGEMKG
ncbi:MAG: hypothetical protein K1X28_06820 [Parachlamydiales bacterium]|nr:hypothetical protein [Parachlamydiales bacterium]